MEREAVRLSEAHLGRTVPHADAEAQLLAEVDGNDERAVEAETARMGEVFLAAGALDCLLPEGKAKQDELWAVRRAIGLAVKAASVYKEEDTVVPRAALPALVRGIKRICAEAGVTSVCYGHAGDGNIHCNLLKMDLDDAAWERRLPGVVEEIFRLTVGLGGMISGEHGIGWVQRRYLPLALGADEIDVMRSLKQAFDPAGILNPDKMLPDRE
jgi:glycolate oxidase